MSKQELKRAIDNCFDYAPDADPIDRLAVLLEAQFYTRELERRSDSRVSIRDLILEIFVILLIGGEIYMGYRAERLQAQNFDKQEIAFNNLNKSSDATAKTLVAVQGTMEGMNGALQKQLALFYEVSVNVIFEPETKLLFITNNGRTNVSIWGDKFGGNAAAIVADGRAIPPGGALKVDAAYVHDFLRERFPKPNSGLVPYELYIKNDRGEKFVQGSQIGIRWQGDLAVLNVQTSSVAPGHWKPGTSGNPAFKRAPYADPLVSTCLHNPQPLRSSLSPG